MSQKTSIQTSALATPATWEIDPSHSSAEFSIKHLMIATVKGSIAVRGGTVRYDPAAPEKTTVQAELDLGTINTNAEQRDGHLKSADFFDVANHPTLTFRSTRVEQVDDEQFRVVGQLGIRGVEREVVLDATYEGEAADPWGGTRAGLVARTAFDRTAWGLTWNQALEAGGFLVGDKVKVELNLQLVKQKE